MKQECSILITLLSHRTTLLQKHVCVVKSLTAALWHAGVCMCVNVWQKEQPHLKTCYIIHVSNAALFLPVQQVFIFVFL